MEGRSHVEYERRRSVVPGLKPVQQNQLTPSVLMYSATANATTRRMAMPERVPSRFVTRLFETARAENARVAAAPPNTRRHPLLPLVFGLIEPFCGSLCALSGLVLSWCGGIRERARIYVCVCLVVCVLVCVPLACAVACAVVCVVVSVCAPVCGLSVCVCGHGLWCRVLWRASASVLGAVFGGATRRGNGLIAMVLSTCLTPH